LGFCCLPEIFLRLLLTCNLKLNILVKGIEVHLQVIRIIDYDEKFAGQLIINILKKLLDFWLRIFISLFIIDPYEDCINKFKSLVMR
jgi:hypothetical protein